MSLGGGGAGACESGRTVVMSGWLRRGEGTVDGALDIGGGGAEARVGVGVGGMCGFIEPGIIALGIIAIGGMLGGRAEGRDGAGGRTDAVGVAAVVGRGGGGAADGGRTWVMSGLFLGGVATLVASS